MPWHAMAWAWGLWWPSKRRKIYDGQSRDPSNRGWELTRLLDPEYENVRNCWAATEQLLSYCGYCVFACFCWIILVLACVIPTLAISSPCTHLQTPSPFVPHKSRDRYNMCIKLYKYIARFNYHQLPLYYLHTFINYIYIYRRLCFGV